MTATAVTRAFDKTITSGPGDLYVDDNMEEAGVSSGSELTELPYAYTIG
jgi:hypothetical protein